MCVCLGPSLFYFFFFLRFCVFGPDVNRTSCSKTLYFSISFVFAGVNFRFVSCVFGVFDGLIVLCDCILTLTCPMGIWCQNDVVSTSMRRNHVASTLIRRQFYVMRPLGGIHILTCFDIHIVELTIIIIWISPSLILGASGGCFHLDCGLHRDSCKQTV